MAHFTSILHQSNNKNHSQHLRPTMSTNCPIDAPQQASKVFWHLWSSCESSHLPCKCSMQTADTNEHVSSVEVVDKTVETDELSTQQLV
jgi:hypothetical protein